MFLAPAPFGPPLLRSASLAFGLAALTGLLAGGVRLLPWAFDPAVPMPVLLPFARGVALLAVEVALLIGWPLGIALALETRVERGEWRSLEGLGERPRGALVRLAPLLVAPLLLLGGASFFSGRAAELPGAMANELLKKGRDECIQARVPAALRVPIVGATWLCSPAARPRVVARAPAAIGNVVVTAEDVQVAPDFRRLELADVHTTLPSLRVSMHVGRLTLRGLAPWFRPSSVPAWARAVSLAWVLVVSCAAVAFVCLRGVVRGRIRAVASSTAGPLAALALMRSLERSDVTAAAYILLPAVALGATFAVALAGSRLPWKRDTATSI